jgi:ABC-type transport system involved in cytochrome c biogenesis permease subunit
MRSKPVTWLLHLALATIVVGACVTHFFGEQGEIHLRNDQAQTLQLSTFNFQLSTSVTLFLWDFHIVYDDADNPVDYISELRLLDRGKSQITNNKSQIVVDSGTVRMNKPLKYHGFRFCQSDYDSDLQGVILAYNYDPWGIGITYTGYALLLIAMIAFFFQPHTRFRALLKSLTAKRSKNAVVLQRSGLAAFAILIIALAIIMTKVVTPKPPLQPVLQTPLLGIHVSVIMLAYTLFAVIMVIGIIGIYVSIASKKAEGARKDKLQITNHKLQIASQMLLYPALFCLTAGIFIGAVWANMSWGRYWGWDPKETWALITMLVYAALLHFPWLPKSKIINHKSPIIYHLFCVVDFALVLFTYFGVSYLLGGLHSYA